MQTATRTPSAAFAGFQPSIQSEPAAWPVYWPCSLLLSLALLAVLPWSRDRTLVRHLLFTQCEVLVVNLGWTGGGACLVLKW